MPQNRIRVVLFVALIAILNFAIAFGPSTFGFSHESDADQLFTHTSNADSPAAEGLADDGEYYLVRQDVRRCISPLCGGYFVKRVNQSRTRCANRRWMKECYVAEIDWNGQPDVEPRKALLRGEIVARRFPRFGNLGALRVTESWQGPSDKAAADAHYRVRDRGVRCITHPCLSHQAAKLNSRLVENIAGVDLAAAGADGEMISEAAAAMTETEGVMVAGYRASVTGPGGRAQTLKATKFYLRAGTQVGGPPSEPKRCFKTGCSSQVCADHDVVTTCEFRPEYACYQKAMCERQASGECGFTETRELLSCLDQARRRP